jgi:hypothetical protein
MLASRPLRLWGLMQTWHSGQKVNANSGKIKRRRNRLAKREKGNLIVYIV